VSSLNVSKPILLLIFGKVFHWENMAVCVDIIRYLKCMTAVTELFLVSRRPWIALVSLVLATTRAGEIYLSSLIFMTLTIFAVLGICA
jgi:hypothetical protein